MKWKEWETEHDRNGGSHNQENWRAGEEGSATCPREEATLTTEVLKMKTRIPGNKTVNLNSISIGRKSNERTCADFSLLVSTEIVSVTAVDVVVTCGFWNILFHLNFDLDWPLERSPSSSICSAFPLRTISLRLRNPCHTIRQLSLLHACSEGIRQ